MKRVAPACSAGLRLALYHTVQGLCLVSVCPDPSADELRRAFLSDFHPLFVVGPGRRMGLDLLRDPEPVARTGPFPI